MNMFLWCFFYKFTSESGWECVSCDNGVPDPINCVCDTEGDITGMFTIIGKLSQTFYVLSVHFQLNETWTVNTKITLPLEDVKVVLRTLSQTAKVTSK